METKIKTGSSEQYQTYDFHSEHCQRIQIIISVLETISLFKVSVNNDKTQIGDIESTHWL